MNSWIRFISITNLSIWWRCRGTRGEEMLWVSSLTNDTICWIIQVEHLLKHRIENSSIKNERVKTLKERIKEEERDFKLLWITSNQLLSVCSDLWHPSSLKSRDFEYQSFLCSGFYCFALVWSGTLQTDRSIERRGDKEQSDETTQFKQLLHSHNKTTSAPNDLFSLLESLTHTSTEGRRSF